MQNTDDWIHTYESAANTISDALFEMGFRPQEADHNARAILARLSNAGITVEPLSKEE